MAYLGKKVLAVILARGGSKGVPRKNIRSVQGKPLIAWTIEAAKRSRYIDRLVLSSDDAEIQAVAAQWGCDVPFTRPPELSRDETPGMDPLLHALDQLPGYDLLVCLQPTSPLRTELDIDQCIETLEARRSLACVSVVESAHSPYWMYTVSEQQLLSPVMDLKGTVIPRRQELPAAYSLNGAVYVAETGFLRAERTFLTSQTVAYVMPEERSLDIDEEKDFDYLEWLLTRRKEKL